MDEKERARALGATLSQIEKQTGNGVSGHTRHAGSGTDGVSLNQCGYYSNLLLYI